MLSKIPISLEKIGKEELDREILRIAIIAELDAVNLYEQMAAMANDEKLERILFEVAREEKTHVGEFQALLLEKDEEQIEELEKGQKRSRRINAEIDVL